MCSLSRADGTTTIARRSTYFQVLVRYRSVGLGETGLHVGLGGGLWEAVDEGRLLRLQLPPKGGTTSQERPVPGPPSVKRLGRPPLFRWHLGPWAVGGEQRFFEEHVAESSGNHRMA